MRTTGTVKWFSDEKGYGFITGDDGKDVFVHRSALPGDVPPDPALDHRMLAGGQRVEYDIVPRTKGPMAARVTVL